MAASTHLPPLHSIIISSLPISLQFSLIMTLISVFIHLRSGALQASHLVYISLFLLLSGYLSLFLIQSLSTFKPLTIDFKFSYILLPLILLALSPVLRTLTEATTDDSIWALSSILLFINWSLADYSDVNPSSVNLNRRSPSTSMGTDVSDKTISADNPIQSPSISSNPSFLNSSPTKSRTPSNSNNDVESKFSTQVLESSPPKARPKRLPMPLPTGPSLPPTPPPLPSSLSLNASISASVVLASRLSSSFQVFSLIFFAAILFAGTPRWRTKVLELSLIDQLSKSDSFKIRLSPNKVNSDLFNKEIKNTSKFNLNLLLKIFPPLISLAISLGLLTSISSRVAVLAFLVMVFISLVCPIWMKWAQRWKNEMRGPWDVGVIRVRS